MQLELFEDRYPPEDTRIWNSLPVEEQQAVIRLLAKLMERIFLTQTTGASNE